MSTDLRDLSLDEIFALEAETQAEILSSSLLVLEKNPTDSSHLEQIMRAADSLKGAARLVNLEKMVALTHAMEERIVEAQKEAQGLNAQQIQLLFLASDIISGKTTSAEQIEELTNALMNSSAPKSNEVTLVTNPQMDKNLLKTHTALEETTNPKPSESNSHIKVDAESMNKSLALAGAGVVQSSWIGKGTHELKLFKSEFLRLDQTLQALKQQISLSKNPNLLGLVHSLETSLKQNEGNFEKAYQELEQRTTRLSLLNQNLYREVLQSRMRPIGDLVPMLQRCVRDLSLKLKKEVELVVEGAQVLIDREALQKLEAPFMQLLRNALDHGFEEAAQRSQLGKSTIGKITLSARSTNRTLYLSFSDDGRGTNLQQLRETIVAKGLAPQNIAQGLNQEELLEFIFLPGFSAKQEVSEISGRGVGLDIVQSVTRALQGNVSVETQQGKGTTFHLQLPVSFSVTKSPVFSIHNQDFALPLAQVVGVASFNLEDIQVTEGREYISWNNQQLGLIDAAKVLDFPETNQSRQAKFCAVILGSQGSLYALLVEKLKTEEDLVLQKLDPRLGKLPNMSAVAVQENGDLVSILNAEDLVQTMNRLIKHNALNLEIKTAGNKPSAANAKILVVDDSLTVRELERKILKNQGYQVEIASDGAEGWNLLSSTNFELLITDLDMPRLNGFELVRMVRENPRLKSLPIIIISYKEREEDRQKGLELGADYYLTKGSFHNDTFLKAVTNLLARNS